MVSEFYLRGSKQENTHHFETHFYFRVDHIAGFPFEFPFMKIGSIAPGSFNQLIKPINQSLNQVLHSPERFIKVFDSFLGVSITATHQF